MKILFRDEPGIDIAMGSKTLGQMWVNCSKIYADRPVALKENLQHFLAKMQAEIEDYEFTTSTKSGWVYILRTVGYNHAKIGWSSDPISRLPELQTGNGHKLEIIRTIPGGRNVETWLKRYFRDLRTGGGDEWFYYTEEMLTIIPPKGFDDIDFSKA